MSHWDVCLSCGSDGKESAYSAEDSPDIQKVLDN